MTELIVIALIVLAITTVFLVYLKSRGHRLSERQQNKISKSWQLINSHSSVEQAILEADKLLDYVLSQKGYRGSLGSKLKAHSKLFSRLNDVWYAHKLRNKIAHELHLQISDSEHAKAMNSFKQALKDLGCHL